MKVVCYISAIPPNNKNQEKKDLHVLFDQGVKTIGDESFLMHGTQIMDCDVALLQGWVHEGSKNAPHLRLRQGVIDHQRNTGKHVLIADSNLFLYTDKDNPLHYLRYSFDGVFPTTGIYFDRTVDPSRWQQIKRDHKIDIKDWKTDGEYILICTQRNGGWSMGSFAVTSWLDMIIREIRRYTDRPIVVRGHPGDRNTAIYLKDYDPRYTLSKNPSILDDFKNAKAVITYNSSPGVAAAIEGIPVFVTDDMAQNSQAYAVANTNLSMIENPIMTNNRQAWIEKICMSHWNFEELRSGKAWAHFKQYV
jgi:hypothetical protein